MSVLQARSVPVQTALPHSWSVLTSRVQKPSWNHLRHQLHRCQEGPSTEEPYIVSGAESISTTSWCSAKEPESSAAHSNGGPIVASSLAKSWTNSEDRTERQRRSAQASYADVIGTISTSIIPVGTGHNGCQEDGTRVAGTGCLSFPPCTKGGSVVPMPSHVLELVLFSSTLSGEAQESTWDLECS